MYQYGEFLCLLRDAMRATSVVVLVRLASPLFVLLCALWRALGGFGARKKGLALPQVPF